MAVLHRDSRGALASQSQSPHHTQNLQQPLKRSDWLTCSVSLILPWVVWHLLDALETAPGRDCRADERVTKIDRMANMLHSIVIM